MTTVETERKSEMRDRLMDQWEAVARLNPEVGTMFSRGECAVLASALAVAETARAVVGQEWTAEDVALAERLRVKACAGAGAAR